MGMKKRLNRTSAYMTIAAAVLLIMNATLGFFLTKESGRALKSIIDNRMLDISNTAAAMLDGDVLATVRAEDVDTPGYQKTLKTLTYYQDNIDLKYIYCIRDTGGGSFVFTIDPTEDDPARFGDPVVSTDALYAASRGKASVDTVPYEDKWGKFYSAYSPVFDSKGNVAGIVAVDFAADWFDRQISNQMSIIIVITGLSLSFGMVIVFMIASRSRKRVRALYKELNSLADGIEELANELSEGEKLEGIELLHEDTRRGDSSYDEVSAIGDKIRSLQKYMRVQIDHAQKKAYMDGLTGLENRTAYLEYSDELDERIRKNQNPSFAIAMFDINGLKEVNDNDGHDSGDSLILDAAGILKSAFTEARIFRIGGDEFVVICEEDGSGNEHGEIPADAGGCFAKYEQIVSSRLDTDSHYTIMSKGYARFDPATDRCFEDTFRRADKLMYESKTEYYEKYGDRRRR